MTKNSMSYKVYKYYLQQLFAGMSDDEIMSYAKERGVTVSKGSRSIDARVAGKIADKALSEGTIPLCAEDSEYERRQELDDSLINRGLMSIGTYRHLLRIHLCNMSREELIKFASDNGINCSNQADSVIIDRVKSVMTERYSTGWFYFYADAVKSVDPNSPLDKCGTKAGYFDRALSIFEGMTADEIQKIGLIYGYTVNKVNSYYMAVNLAKKITEDKFGHEDDNKDDEKMLEVRLYIKVKGAGEMANTIKEIKSKVADNHKVVEAKCRAFVEGSDLQEVSL